jgi:hypothetical protein
MRGFQKKQLLDSVEVLREAGGVLKEQQPGAEKVNLCADMQDFTLAILNFLDNINEDDEKLTDQLSELYKILLNVSQEEVSCEEPAALIDQIRDYVEEKEQAEDN